MTQNLEISNLSLMLSTLLIMLAVSVDFKEKIGLSKDIIIASVRSVIQLFIIGYVLAFVFKVDNFWLTLVMVAFMIFNASYHAHKTSNGIKHSFRTSFLSIGIGTSLALIILVLSGTLDWVPSQIVPITGMISSSAMTTIGVIYRTLLTQFNDRRQQIQEKLALGATSKQASHAILRDSIRIGMTPSISSTKTVGLVSLPGMMSGLIFAGIDPTHAIRYQIVVMFTMISVATLSSFIASYLTYQTFYNDQLQLKLPMTK
ncbi:ABC transporter permease [Fundicoccus sp. Sow4_D5]|uniref:ABC transporter permease n=1 Tax=Fundicoccus sp. Sow4_D5 TaxID=3438782 RepID=UPI003F90908A